MDYRSLSQLTDILLKDSTEIQVCVQTGIFENISLAQLQAILEQVDREETNDVSLRFGCFAIHKTSKLEVLSRTEIVSLLLGPHQTFKTIYSQT